MRISRWIFAAVLAGAPLVFAVDTESWVHNDKTDFEKGILKNLSLRSNGRLTLAPEFRELADLSVAYLWTMAADSKGILYTGGGNPGSSTSKVFAVDTAGKSRTVAEVPGLQIQAIAVDRQDRVYAATAPDGKVYRITSGGKADVFYDPKAHYIWALAFNAAGDLFVATGDAGEIHRVKPDGTGSVFFRTEETHARSMAVDGKDNLIVGTEPSGLILRISPAGEGFVLYQAARREVTAVAVAPDGSIYAAAVGTKSGNTGYTLAIPTPPPAPAPGSAQGAGPRAGSSLPPGPGMPPPATASVAGGSEVYRIATDNYPQKVWAHPVDIVYAIAFDSGGHAILGTGNKGNLYRVESQLVSTLLINADPTQITALTSGPSGRLFAVTGNVGKLYAIGPGLEKQGTYESEPLDVGFFSFWGRASGKSDLNGGTVQFETRSGNLDRTLSNWSRWAPPDGQQRVTSPSARFLQYRVSLTAGPSGLSPELREIEVAWKAKNVAPVIEQIEITPANYKFNASSILSATSPVPTISLQPIGSPRRTTTALTVDTTSASAMIYAKGFSGARWSSTDPNGDEMLYKVEIRGVKEHTWRLLRDKLKEKYLAIDSTSFPDGEYTLRVTATDAPDNPADQAISTVLESDRFVLDNTPPVIRNLTGTRSGDRLTIRWGAQDSRSIVSKSEYSLNGTDWILSDPVNGLSDASELDYSLSLTAAGTEAVVAVRVTDEYDNQSVAKVVIP
ncbi:MAG: hypothetical protein H7Y20_14405 [Bryobacteraceae bacterium]|nr:hypothetical protein [Bryobacteraceae bacterium]